MNRGIDRRTFLKTAGFASVAAGSFPALLATRAAFAGPANGQRAYSFVAISQAPAGGGGASQARIATRGDGVFKPDTRWVHGGGTFVLFDNGASGTPKPILAAGEWTPTKFLSYDTKSLSPYGTIQPSILEMLADFEGVASGATLRIICNVGAAGPAGSTGELEGYMLSGTPFGTFTQITPCPGVVLGLTHIGLEGSTIDRGS